MGAINVLISDEIEKKFREMAIRLYGHGKGSLSIASEKAFSAWLSHVSKVIDLVELVEDPVDAIYGSLSGVKGTGLELQHKARAVRTKRALRYRNTV